MSKLYETIVGVLREHHEVRNISTIAKELEVVVRAQILDKIHDAYSENHGTLGIMLADKKSSDTEVNWQGGRVNGLSVAYTLFKEDE